jgi:hypothetical protein
MRTKSTAYVPDSLDTSLITHEAAAAELGIDLKRLRGFLMRNYVGDPIGDERYVYRWSLKTLRERLAHRADGVTP